MFGKVQSASGKWFHTTARLLVGAALLSPLAAYAQGAKPAAKPAAKASASASAPAASASAAAAPSASAATSATAPAGTAAPASTLATGSAGSVDGATYAVRLRDLEQRINELKEQIRR